MFSGFTFGADSISEENYLCLLSLVLCLFIIAMHVILSVKDPKIIMVA